MRDIVQRAPHGFGANPARYRYDVIFLKDSLTAKAAMKSVLTKEDEAHAGVGVLYFSRLISKAFQTRLSRIVSMPIYDLQDGIRLEKLSVHDGHLATHIRYRVMKNAAVS